MNAPLKLDNVAEEDRFAINTRLITLESRVNTVEKETAVANVEFLSVKEDLKEIKSSLTWVTRLIIGALIVALVSFMLNGGLSLVN